MSYQYPKRSQPKYTSKGIVNVIDLRTYLGHAEGSKSLIDCFGAGSFRPKYEKFCVFDITLRLDKYVDDIAVLLYSTIEIVLFTTLM